jgi:hypothetical protein
MWMFVGQVPTLLASATSCRVFILNGSFTVKSVDDLKDKAKGVVSVSMFFMTVQ